VCMKHLKFILIISFCLVVFAKAQVWKSLGLPPMNVSKIIVDSLNQRAILFGGGFGGNYWSDGVYEMPLTDTIHYTWSRLSVAGPHHKRGYHTFTYDPAQQRGIVFGGDTTNGYPNYMNDMWSLNLQLGAESWQRLNTIGTPPIPRANPGDIYHPTRNSLILFGGIDINGLHLDDVWELKLDSLIWRQINIIGTRPAKRQHFASAFDQLNNRMIIFGGRGDNGSFYNDVWALDLSLGNEQWKQLYPTGIQPPVLCTPAYGYDSRRRKLYVFGGWSYYGGFTFYNDVYVLDISSLTWTKLYPSGDVPQERRCAAGTYDIFNDNFIIFGGDNYSQFYSDTHILFLCPISSTSEWNLTTTYITPDILINSPTAGSVRIRYILPKSDNIKVNIIDVNGRLIRTLYAGKPSNNTGWLIWDKRNNENKEVSAGIYFCSLETEDMSLSKKFVIVK